MKLYTISGQSLREPRRWVGTQDEAKKGAKELQGMWEIVEVPTDKPGLIKFLNGMEEPRYQAPAPIPRLDPLQLAEARAAAGAQQVTTMSRQVLANDVIEFVLDGATVAQVEQIFSALGTRFKELSNGTQ